MTLVYIAVSLAIVFSLWVMVGEWKIRRDRARGLYPQLGQETEADIEDLLRRGEKIYAIRVYRQIHGVGLKQAKEAIESLSEQIES